MVDDLHSGSAHHADFHGGREDVGELTTFAKWSFLTIVALSSFLFGLIFMKVMRVEKKDFEQKKGS